MTSSQTTEDIDWDFYNYALDLEKEWRKSLPRLNDKELLEIFPEAKEVIPEKIVEWEQKRDRFSDAIKKKLTLIKQQISDEFGQWFWREWIKLTDGKNLLETVTHIERLKRLQALAEGTEPKRRITDEQIQRARAVPIEDVFNQPLRKSGKVLVGLCPLHKEKHPSFNIYLETNSCWCYGCNQGGDAISFIRLLHGFSFKEAVLYLTKN